MVYHFPGLTLSRTAVRFVCFVILAALLAPGAAQAHHGGTHTWISTANGAWNDTERWSGNIPPSLTTDSADFNTINIVNAELAFNLNGDRSIASMTFGDTDTSSASDWNVYNNTLTLTGAGGNITVNALGSGKSARIQSVLAGTVGLTKLGTGTLSFENNPKTFSGDLIISAGTVKLNAHNLIPNGAGKGNVTVNVNGTLDLNTFSDTINGLSGSGIVDTIAGGTVTLTLGDNNANGTFSGIIKDTSGTLHVTKTGTGTQTLSGANDYAGKTTVSVGILVAANNTALGAPGGDAQINVGAELHLTGGITVGSELTYGGGTLRSVSGNNIWGGQFPDGTPTDIKADLGSTLTLTASPLGVVSGPYGYLFSGAGVIQVNNELRMQSSGLTKGYTASDTGTLILVGNSTANSSGNNGWKVNCGTLRITSPGIAANTHMRVGGSANAGSGYGTSFGTPTLAGNGTCLGQVTIAGTAPGVPGTIAGVNGSTLTINNILTLESGSKSTFDLTGAPAVGAAIAVTTLSVGAANYNTITIPTVGQAGTYKLFSYTSTGLTVGFQMAGSGNAPGYGFAINYNNAGATKYIEVVVTSPSVITITGAPGAVSTTYGTASANASPTFSVSGAAMFAGILVTPPSTAFEVALNAAGPFTPTVTVGSSGTIPSTPVYIRLKATAGAGAHSGNIVCSSAGADNKTVAMPLSTVNPVPLTVTGAAVTSKPYDGNNTATITGTLNGVLGGDTVTLIGTGTFASVNVANGIAVTSTSTLGGAQGANYTLTQPAPLTGDITPKALTVTANSFDKLGGTAYTPDGTEFTASGLVGSETVSSVTLSCSGFDAGAVAGTYNIVPSAATGGTFNTLNYTISYVNGTLSVVAPAVWDGGSTVDSNWNTPANWQPDGVPVSGQALQFPAGAARQSNNNNLSLSFRNIWFAGGTGANAYTLSGNAVTLTNGAPAILSSSGTHSIGLNLTFSAPVPTIAVDANTLTISGTIAGTSALTKTGTGTLTLGAGNGANTYSGDTIISAGTVKLNTNDVIPNGAGKGNVTVNGTLDLNTFSETINGLSGSGIVDTIAGGSPTLNLGDNNANGTFSGIIRDTAGTLHVSKTGTGTQTLSGANDYDGPTTISTGTLAVAGSGWLGGGSYAGAITNNGAFLYNSAATQTLSGVISGSGTLTVSNGVLTLSGANTYTNVTTVGGGTLIVNGTNSGAGAVLVTNSATFGGMGAVTGAVTYASGSTGIFYKTTGSADTPLRLDGNLTLNSNTVTVDIAGSALGAGTYVLATNVGSGTISGSFATNPVISGLAGGASALITNNTKSVSLVVTVGAAPTITNDGGASNVLVRSASFYGYLTSTGGLPTAVYLYWATNDFGTTNTTWTYTNYFGTNDTGVLTTNITTLTGLTTYYYRFFATNSAGGGWASPATNFTTLDPDADADGDGVNNGDEETSASDLFSANSYLHIISMDLDNSVDIAMSIFVGPNRTVSIVSSDTGGGAKTVHASMQTGSAIATNTWTDTNAVNEANNRFYSISVSHAGYAFTNTEEWAMFVQARVTNRWYMVGVPVNLGSSNNLNSTLGAHLARGLSAGNTNTADYLYYLQTNTWREFYLSSAGGTNWWDPDTDTNANLSVSATDAFWVKRGTNGSPSTKTVFTGRTFTNSPSVNMSTNNDGWTIFAWPHPKPRGQTDLGTSTITNAFGLVAAGAAGGTVSTNADQILIWTNSGSMSYWNEYWLIDMGNPDYDDKWWHENEHDFGTFSFEPGKAYYFRRRGASGFSWTPEEN